MTLLQRFVDYNSWANRRVFGVCAGLDAEMLGRPAPGSIGTVEETLKHMIAVEDGYLVRLNGGEPPALGDREAYMKQEFSWFVQRSGELAVGYEELVAREDDDSLAREVRVPWIPVPMTRIDQYLQVLSHSTHHRAQAFSILGSRGIEVPDLDYVFLLSERGG